MTRYQPGDDTSGWSGAAQGRRRRQAADDWEQASSRPAGRRRAQDPRRAPSRRKAGLLRRRPVLTSIAMLTTLVLAVGSLYFYLRVRSVYDSIHRETVTSAMLGPRPPKLNGSTNILLIGSDSRKGLHGKYGHGIYGSRSDTTMLVHISPTHTRAVVVSFPRDSMVPIYQCYSDHQGHSGQQAAPGQLEQLNATFSAGGAPCLWKTLEQTTHIHIDHFIEVNFLSFKKIVNDIGGVPVCLPYAVNDPLSGLRLSAGRHLIKGAQALAFVRVRHIGLGSDLQRITRQQVFLASAMNKIRHSGILTSPTGVLNLAKDVASSLTTDMSLNDMEAVANSVRGLSTKYVRFVSVPVLPYPPNPLAWVEWEQPQANTLFKAIAHDNHVPRTPKGAGKPTATPLPTVSPGRVQLQVLNGSGTAGVATTVASELTGRGFDVTGTGNAPSFNFPNSVIEYASASQLPAVNTLKQEVSGVQVKQVASLPAATLDLIVGSNYTSLATKSAKTSKVSVNHLKGYAGISGNANICKDTSAFAG